MNYCLKKTMVQNEPAHTFLSDTYPETFNTLSTCNTQPFVFSIQLLRCSRVRIHRYCKSHWFFVQISIQNCLKLIGYARTSMYLHINWLEIGYLQQKFYHGSTVIAQIVFFGITRAEKARESYIGLHITIGVVITALNVIFSYVIFVYTSTWVLR